jgi:outer membrane lipoprotein-sorting protein
MIKSQLTRLIAVLIAGAFLFTPSRAGAQSQSRDVINQTIKALGGPAFLDVKEIQTAGRFFSFKKGELVSSDYFADFIKFPDMERTEFGREKKKTITINKGTQGWIINPKEKEVEPQPVAQSDDFLISFKTSIDYVLRFVLTQPQTTVQSLGNEIIDFKRADVIEIRDPSKNLIRFYIDRGTRLPMKMQVRRSNEREIREDIFGNWHNFQGVMTPMFVTRSVDGLKTMEIRLESAAYNPGLDDSLFSPTIPK